MMKQLFMAPIREWELASEIWVGGSAALKLTKQRLIVMANSRLPVFLFGEKGTGKAIAARMLHDTDKGSDAPFVSIHCQNVSADSLLKRIEDGWKEAEGGSLYICHIEKLGEKESIKLRTLLSTMETVDSDKQVRLITSTRHLTVNRNEFTSEGSFMGWMKYHSFILELPTLEDRADDIESLIYYYKQQIPGMVQLNIDANALSLLEQSQWPENVFQLRRCLETLVIAKPFSDITKQDLLESFPYMENHQNENEKHHINIELNQSIETINKPKKDLEANSFINILVDNNPLGNISNIVCNPTLESAITYLYNNFTQPISLNELASHVCISSSHLSYLFKKSLGFSFKQTLLLLRIVEAMRLLTENPSRQVTQVCDDVGFCDLSFFIRKFKATVGMSPGAYRNQYGHIQTSPEFLKVEEALAHPLLQLPVKH